METTEFFTFAFTLACTIGPVIGLSLAIGLDVLDRMRHGSFAITIGKRPQLPKSEKEARHDHE